MNPKTRNEQDKRDNGEDGGKDQLNFRGHGYAEIVFAFWELKCLINR
jgi:hypothetical protein